MRLPTTAGGAVLTVIGIIVVLVMRGNSKGDASKEVLELMRTVVMRCEGYDANREYIDYILEDCHEELFDKTYTAGWGRRARAEFDEAQYVEEFFPLLIARANRDGSKHIAEALGRLQRDIEDPDEKPRSRTGSR